MPHLNVDVDAVRRLARDLDEVVDALEARGVPPADEFALGPGRSAGRLASLLRDWEHRRLAAIDDVTTLSAAVAETASAYEHVEVCVLRRFVVRTRPGGGLDLSDPGDTP